MADERQDYEDEAVDENYNPETEVIGDWKPQVHLPEVTITTGEEEEELVAKLRSKLYRWHDNQWKERGVGDLKFLKHKKNGKIRVLLREDKTNKIRVNFIVQAVEGLCTLTKL